MTIDQPTMCLLALIGPVVAFELGFLAGWFTGRCR